MSALVNITNKKMVHYS